MAEPNGSARISGFTATLGPLRKVRDDLCSCVRLCSHVTLTNRDTKTQPYDELDFSIQSPRGNVTAEALVFSGGIQSGELVHNGKVSGRTCFVNNSEPGLYIVSWTPDSPSDAPRAVWLFRRN